MGPVARSEGTRRPTRRASRRVPHQTARHGRRSERSSGRTLRIVPRYRWRHRLSPLTRRRVRGLLARKVTIEERTPKKEARYAQTAAYLASSFISHLSKTPPRKNIYTSNPLLSETMCDFWCRQEPLSQTILNTRSRYSSMSQTIINACDLIYY